LGADGLDIWLWLVKLLNQNSQAVWQELSGLNDFSGLQAAGANTNSLDATADHGPHCLKIRVKAAFRAIVGVAHAVAELGPLAAHFASFGHRLSTSDRNIAMRAKQQFNTARDEAVKPIFRRSTTVFRFSKPFTGAVLIIASLISASCGNSSERNESESVAKVGSKEITMKQVDAVIKQQLDQSGGGSFTPSELVAARMSVLENLIQEEALFQRAQKDNLVPDDAKVTQTIQQQKAANNLTEDQYRAQIKQAGLTEDEIRDKVRRELAINAIRDRERARISQPTDSEIEKYYDDHKTEFVAERGVDLAVIVTDPANNGQADDAIGDAQAEQKIKAIHEQLKGGADFATIASQRSEDPNSAIRGGALGFATEAQLKQIFPTKPELQQRLMSMSTGQYTEPIKDPGSSRWYVIKVNNKIEQARNLSLNDVRANIINSITQQRQGLLLNALLLVVVNEAGVKNYLAERIVATPQTIVEMRPSQILEQASRNAQQQQPRFENQNQGNANRPSSSTANSSSPANANRK
jgi:parvulin-like peptidyl-prolyl isomerase